MDSLVDHLRERLKQPLPGRAAQLKMATLRRMQELDTFTLPPDNARVAAVMVLLHRENAGADWQMVLIERTSNPRDRHSGQISLPGGSWEPSDGSLEAVALRESHEEVGVSPLQVQLLGRLTELYIPVSNFLVHPFVGYIQGRPEFLPQPSEVEKILTPSFRLFFEPEYIKSTDLTVSTGITLKDVPYFDVDGRVVWGATAMIISELVQSIDPQHVRGLSGNQ